MVEIRIHGRGGQGNVVAAYLLATAAIHQGRCGQAFPAFGAERRGAPVVAFVRITSRPLRRRCQVREPAYLIVQDSALLHVAGVTDGLQPGGRILVNSSRPVYELAPELADRALTVPATRLAEEHLGRPLPNTALLAAFLTLTGLLPLEALAQTLRERFSGPVRENNLHLIEAAAAQVEADAWRQTADA